MNSECVFCVKVYDLDGVLFTPFEGVYRFEPLNPVVPGHQLFVNSIHTKDAAEDPAVTAVVFGAAAAYGRDHPDDFNLITSAGTDATQTVEHLHVHYVPRRPNDGLHLPWTGQIK